MDHAQGSEADVLKHTEGDVLGEGLTGGDKLHDSKHVIDFIQNEVQTYDNVFVPKNKVSDEDDVRENGVYRRLDSLDDGEELEKNSHPSHVDLLNGSHEPKSSLPSTPFDDDDLLKPEMLHKPAVHELSVHSSTPGEDVTASKSNSDLLREELADLSPIKSSDSVDVEKAKHLKDFSVDDELLRVSPEPKLTEILGSANQFHLHEKAHEPVEEPLLKPTKPTVPADDWTCDLMSAQSEEIKSTPSPVEPVATPKVEISPKIEPKIEKEVPKVTKSEKSAEKPRISATEKPEIGPKDFFTKYGLDTWFNPDRLDPTVEAYIYWRDPKLSGIVFGSGLLLLLSMAYFSLISVVANSGLAILTCAIVFRIYKDIMQAVQKTPQTHPYSVFLSRDIALPQEKVHELVDTLILHLNACLGELRRLFLVEDMIESLKFALVLWILTYVGSWFNGLTLVIIGFVSLFTLPKVYENNKVQIDQNLALVRAKVEELANKIRDALPAPLRRKVPEKKE